MVPALRAARTGLSKVNSYGVFVRPPPTPKESKVRNLERISGPTRLRHIRTRIHPSPPNPKESNVRNLERSSWPTRLRHTHTHTHGSTHRHRLRRSRTYVTSNAVRGPRLRHTHASTHRHGLRRSRTYVTSNAVRGPRAYDTHTHASTIATDSEGVERT